MSHYGYEPAAVYGFVLTGSKKDFVVGLKTQPECKSDLRHVAMNDQEKKHHERFMREAIKMVILLW